MLRFAFATVAFLATSGTAMAGITLPVPDPEAGVGFASMTLLGLGVAWLRKRKGR